jgi:hypothetical protein
MATIIGISVHTSVKAQGPSSFYFTSAQPRGADFISHVPKAWCGLYKSGKDTTLRLHITRDSIYTEAPSAIVMPVADAQQEGYTIMDSLITVKEDTLPCWVHADTVYFFMYFTNTMYKPNSKQTLYEHEDYLVLSTQNDKGDWETTLFINQGQAVEIAFFDHAHKENEIAKRKKIKQETRDGGTVYYASFKEKEWKHMMSAEWFPDKHRFNKSY